MRVISFSKGTSFGILASASFGESCKAVLKRGENENSPAAYLVPLREALIDKNKRHVNSHVTDFEKRLRAFWMRCASRILVGADVVRGCVERWMGRPFWNGENAVGGGLDCLIKDAQGLMHWHAQFGDECIANTERTMSDRYIVKRRDAAPVSCVSERQALQRAAELFDVEGRKNRNPQGAILIDDIEQQQPPGG